MLLPSVGFGMFGDTLIAGAGLGVLVAVYVALRPRGRYDLQDLQAFHESEELRGLDPGEVSGDADEVICPRCGTTYSTRFRVCPNCVS